MKLDLISFFQAFLTLFAIFDPIGILPIILSLTESFPEEVRKKIINTSCLASLGILLAFAYAGTYLFQLFDITLIDFKVVGGLILLIFSIRYVLGREIDKFLPGAGEDIAVFPLATPLLAGPGSISVVIILVNPPFGPLTTLLAIVLNVLFAWVILRVGIRLYKLLGKQGSSAISRIMGLIIGAIAFKLIREGMSEVISQIM